MPQPAVLARTTLSTGTELGRSVSVYEGSVVAGGEPVASFDRPVALVVGEEAHGLPANLIDAADQAVTLEMPGGTESLNAAVAAAILMWELRRGR